MLRQNVLNIPGKIDLIGWLCRKQRQTGPRRREYAN
jgi:hypothetical protein